MPVLSVMPATLNFALYDPEDVVPISRSPSDLNIAFWELFMKKQVVVM